MRPEIILFHNVQHYQWHFVSVSLFGLVTVIIYLLLKYIRHYLRIKPTKLSFEALTSPRERHLAKSYTFLFKIQMVMKEHTRLWLLLNQNVKFNQVQQQDCFLGGTFYYHKLNMTV